MSKRQKLFDKDLIVKLLNEKNTYAEILEVLELPRSGGNCYVTLKSNLKKWGVDLTEFEERQKEFRAQQSRTQGQKKRINFEDVFMYNPKCVLSGNNMKQKLYDNNIKEKKCEMCGQNEIWCGKKISLILDHISGNRIDNRVENLRILCPNCNATLDTHCSKNRTPH